MLQGVGYEIYALGDVLCQMKTMAGLQCVCGDVFAASCDIEPTGCAFAYLLLFLSMVAHALHHCKTDECESDDEPSTMYS